MGLILDWLQINRSMFAATINLDIKFQTITFIEVRHASAFNGADVNECIRLTIIALNEAEALHRVEEFHCTIGCFAGQLALRTTATTKAAAITTTVAARFAGFTRSAFFNRKRFAFDFKIGRRNFAAAIHQGECERLAFSKAAQARLLDRADVNEHIFAAFITLDEAETFLAIEEFNNAVAFAYDLRGHATTGTASCAATAAEAATTAAAAEAATITAAKTASVTAAAEATAITAKAAASTAAAIATFLIKGIDTFFAEIIALIAPTPTTGSTTTAAVISVETHALNVTFASSLKL